MADAGIIERIDANDPRVEAAKDAESRLASHYGLTPREHYVELDAPRIRIRVLEVGDGAPVLLVPGGSGEAFQFIPLMAELSGWRLLTLNMPGAGLSDGVDYRRVAYRRLAVDVLTAVLDAFQLERPPIIATSVGGLWCLWLALEKPERVARLALLACPALILGSSAVFPMRLQSVPLLNRLVFPFARPSNAEQARRVLGILGCPKDVLEAMPDVLPETAYRMFNLPTYRTAWLSFLETALTLRGANPRHVLGGDDLRRVVQPVRFIWGDGDPFGNVDVGRRAAALMPNAELDVVRGGHLPFFDDPAACARHIQDFLRPAGG